MRVPTSLVVLLAVGCGDGDPIPVDAATDVDGSIPGIVDAPFGYDTRPVSSCVAPPRPTSAGAPHLEQVFGAIAFNQPLALMQAPGEPDRYYVVEQTGAIKAFGPSDLTATTVLFYPPYPASQIASGGEMGLLGLAFAPDWPTSRIAYVSRNDWIGSSNSIRSIVARVRSLDSGQTLDYATQETIFSLDQPYQNHHGGQITFGPDGYLYFALGDGGGGGDPQGNGQNLKTLQGSVLRLSVGATGTYTVPADNPFVGVGGGVREEIWAYGLRNPWRFSFDRATGALWLGDVGQDFHEEIDLIERGGNYGWGIREGSYCYFPAVGCPSAGLIDPVIDYSHLEGVSVTGGYVYRGTAIPSLAGTYLFGDFGSGKIWILVSDGGTTTKQLLIDSGLAISSMGEGLDGELYVVDYGGSIWKVVPSSGAAVDDLPGKLSQTGCVSASDPTKSASGMIPYAINAPFWSDGADKDRAIAIPIGQRARILPDGDLDLPTGTVVTKTFRLAGAPVETRLFMRHPDGVWAGYSYEWDDDGKDATLLLAGKQKSVAGQTWTFPSRGDCLRCHTAAAGRTLGLELAQLERVQVYPETQRRAPQLDTWAHVGLFERPYRGRLDPLPVPYGDGVDLSPGKVAPRARAWLHVNCSMCHRPGGPGVGPQDLRYPLSLSDTHLCGTDPTRGDLGVIGAKLLVPGDASRSIVAIRAGTVGSGRMPPLVNSRVDAEGYALLQSWIDGLSACP